jgi:zinc transport system permease protein
MIFTTIGLLVSFAFDLTSGAAIILVSAVAYLAALVIRSQGRAPS